MSATSAPPRVAEPHGKLLVPGDVVDGRYRIEAYLGGGGMASVYRATHVVLEQAVAIKVVSPQIREVPGIAQRFLREARAATQLKSEHVARVTDVGTMADGAPYMVMEYLDGCDLDAVLERPEGVPVEDAVDYVLQACEALAEVHGLGIVHRDLKPANLFLTRGADGLPCVKLIDFGISRVDSPLDGKDLAKLTHPEAVMGSPRYMSPEQMESASKADARSDIYGLGAVLYELLTNKAPHDGETFLDIYASATNGPPQTPSALRREVPRELDAIVLKALAPEPSARFADVAELALALAPFGPEGAPARADAIARVLEAARSRSREGTSEAESVSSDEGSKVRRRVSRSAHALKRRRLVRGGMLAAVLAVVALGVGGRSFMTHAPKAAATATAKVEPVAPAAPAETAALVPGHGPAAAAADPVEAAGTTQTTSGIAEGTPAASAPATTESAAVGTTTTTTTTAADDAKKRNAKVPSAPAPRAAVPAWRPTATPTPAAPPQPPPPAPTTDERKLFEERK